MMTNRNKTLKLGIIGCGNVTIQRHLPVLKSLKTVEVVAAADIDKRQLKQAVDRFHIRKSFADYKRLLSDPSVEAVGVFVPLQLHFEVAMAALMAQKHLLLEKPMTMTLDEADQLIEQAAKTDRKVMMGLNKRWHRLVRRARKIIEDKKLGAIHLINIVSSSGQDCRTVPAWRVKRHQGGGNLIENGTHFYDLWSHLLQDDIEEVFAVSASKNNCEDEPAIITARTTNGIFLNCALSDFSPNRSEIEILGENCVLSLSLHRFDGFEFTPSNTCSGDIGARLKSIARFFKELPIGLIQYRYGGDYTESFRAQWKHFIDCIQKDKPVECTLEDGRHALEIALAAVKSVLTGQLVKLTRAPRKHEK